MNRKLVKREIIQLLENESLSGSEDESVDDQDIRMDDNSRRK